MTKYFRIEYLFNSSCKPVCHINTRNDYFAVNCTHEDIDELIDDIESAILEINRMKKSQIKTLSRRS